MISCTEFIPAYSELFFYLEEKYGREEVDHFWEFLFCPESDRFPNGKYPLYAAIEAEGIRGCFTYWSVALNEEAADFTLYLNEKRGYYMMDMRRCPSKGRLLEQQEQTGMQPYPHYCLHCDYYRLSVEKAGLRYLFDFAGVDRAACKLIIYDPKVFDGRVIVDEDTVIMDRKAFHNEYFHRSFHSSMNRGIQYLGDKGGEEDVRGYLTRYTKNICRQLIRDIRQKGLGALEARWREIYEKEKASHVLTTDLKGSVLRIEIASCPGLTYLHEAGYAVSPWYHYTKSVVMEVLAQECGLTWVTESYDEQTGAAVYRFEK